MRQSCTTKPTWKQAGKDPLQPITAFFNPAGSSKVKSSTKHKAPPTPTSDDSDQSSFEPNVEVSSADDGSSDESEVDGTTSESDEGLSQRKVCKSLKVICYIVLIVMNS